MKILSVGNSFSQDAHRYLYSLAKACGYDWQTVNLYYPGCSLEQHWDFYTENSTVYDLEPNGGTAVRKISLSEVLETDKWDVITLQQASYHSGRPQSYFPYLHKLIELLRAKQPQARLYFHETWSYEIDSAHDNFGDYGCNQQEMCRRIADSVQMVEKIVGLPVIHAGTLIQKLRDTVLDFNYKNGGLSLCRDGFHLSLDYGRFAVAALWVKALSGERLNIKEFEELDGNLVQKIIDVVNE